MYKLKLLFSSYSALIIHVGLFFPLQLKNFGLKFVRQICQKEKKLCMCKDFDPKTCFTGKKTNAMTENLGFHTKLGVPINAKFSGDAYKRVLKTLNFNFKDFNTLNTLKSNL